MKKVIGLFCLLLASSILMGCEDAGRHDDNEDGDNFIFSETLIVEGHGDVLTPTSNDLLQVEVVFNEFTVIVTSSTTIQVMRDSGSGFENGDLKDIGTGDQIEIRFTDEMVNYDYDPKVVRPMTIRIRKKGSF